MVAPSLPGRFYCGPAPAPLRPSPRPLLLPTLPAPHTPPALPSRPQPQVLLRTHPGPSPGRSLPASQASLRSPGAGSKRLSEGRSNWLRCVQHTQAWVFFWIPGPGHPGSECSGSVSPGSLKGPCLCSCLPSVCNYMPRNSTEAQACKLETHTPGSSSSLASLVSPCFLSFTSTLTILMGSPSPHPSPLPLLHSCLRPSDTCPGKLSRGAGGGVADVCWLHSPRAEAAGVASSSQLSTNVVLSA